MIRLGHEKKAEEGTPQFKKPEIRIFKDQIKVINVKNLISKTNLR